MVIVYPNYIIDQKVYNELWSIDDGTGGFYGDDVDLKKRTDSINKAINNMSYYWSEDVDYFKLVIDEYTGNSYEGVFNKNDYNIRGYQSGNNISCIYQVLQNLTIQEKTEEHIILNYENKLFTLSKINFDYITKLSENTKKLNDLIKEKYETSIYHRKKNLEKRMRD